MRTLIVAGAMAAFLVASAAQAESVSYSWTGIGTNVPGSSKCATYKMKIDVTLDGNAVKGLFQQQGRDQRHFEATKDSNGLFKTKAVVGGGGSMDVSGSLKDGSAQILLDGYCKFGGPLTKN